MVLMAHAYCADINPLPTAMEYRLDVKIDYSTKKLYVFCEITFSNETESPVDTVPLLLYRLLSVKHV